MDLIHANKDMKDIGAIPDYSLDLAYGEEENDFELQVAEDCCNEHEYIYVEKTVDGRVQGTEYGGIIDKKSIDTENNTRTYYGRTWHGILDGKIIEPPKNTDYLTVNGDANEVIRTIIRMIGLDDLFEVPASKSGIEIINYQFRYVQAYKGLRTMLQTFGGKLKMRHYQKKIQLWAEHIVDYSKQADWDSTQVTFTASNNYTPINHLICLGKGDMVDRAVIHIFTDAKGDICPYAKKTTPLQDEDYILDKSQQVIFGTLERTEIYDYSNAEITENYIVLTKQPANWPAEYGQYYINKNDKFEAVTGTESNIYTLLSTQPARWSTEYSNYYEVENDTYKAVEGNQTYQYVRLESMPAKWDTNYGDYYYYYSDGATDEYKKVSGESRTRYKLQTRCPTDWQDRYMDYYIRNQDGSYSNVEQDTTPQWQSNTYYTSENYTVAPGWKADYYYQQKIGRLQAPEWANNKYYLCNKNVIAPVFAAGIYYRKVIDRYATLVAGALEKLREYANGDTVNANLDLEKNYDIGDIVGATDLATKISIWQPITKKIVKIKENREEVQHEIGKEQL